MAMCLKCNKHENDLNLLTECDSCHRNIHKKVCSGLNASEIKVIDLKGKRLLRFYCEDCSEGLLMVPKLIKMVDELKAEVSSIKSNIEDHRYNDELVAGLTEIRNRVEKLEYSNEVPSHNENVSTMKINSIQYPDMNSVIQEMQERESRRQNFIIYKLFIFKMYIFLRPNFVITFIF